MSQTAALLTVEYHTDDDTGIYSVGEIDFGIRVHALDEFLRPNPYERKKEILNTLGYLAHKVVEAYEKISEEEYYKNQAQEKSA